VFTNGDFVQHYRRDDVKPTCWIGLFTRRTRLSVHIATNAPTNASWARESLSTSREAVPNLNQCIRVGTDRGKGISAVRTTL
jgi:hypothetical protein